MSRAHIHEKKPPQSIGKGLWLDRIQPGGRRGPDDETLRPLPGGQVWSDFFLLGNERDAFQMMVPDIRLPANQYWPLHWHDCWIAVVILDGNCLIGDWWMETGDVLITASGIEYGPLLIGPDGCQMFEVFAQMHTHMGGYAPEYRDHPTLAGGDHAFMARKGVNIRNEGRMSLSCDGIDGLIKGHLTDGQRWDLGEADDPERGVIACTVLRGEEWIAPHSYADWHSLFILKGGLHLGEHVLKVGDVIMAEPGARLEKIKASADGASLFECARIVGGMERQL
jgi:hypothetical protein